MRDRPPFNRVAMPRFLAGVLLAFVSIGTAGCDPMGLDTLTYTYGGTTYDSSADALDAERRDNEAVLAAITKRDRPIASTASILLPSEDRLFELTFAPRCVAYFCRSESSVYEEKTYKAKSWHEDLLTTARSVERSNLFGKVDVEDYDKIDRARINSAGDLVIAVHGTELGHEKGG